MIDGFAFEHNGEWHYSIEPEPDAKKRHEKWEFLRTHKVKHFYETNEELKMKFKELFESRKNIQGKVFLLPKDKEVQKNIIRNGLIELIDAAIYCGLSEEDICTKFIDGFEQIPLEKLEKLIDDESKRLEREGVEPVKVEMSLCEK